MVPCLSIGGFQERVIVFPYVVLKEKPPNSFSLSFEGPTVGSLELPQIQEECGVWMMSQLMESHCCVPLLGFTHLS